MRWLLLLPLGCLPFTDAFSKDQASGKTDAETKAAAEADRLYDFLRGLDVQKKKASATANRYEDFLLQPESARRKTLDELKTKQEDRYSSRQHKDIAHYLKSKGLTPGSGFWANVHSLERLKAEVDALEKKDPQKYESLVSDPDARARKLVQYGVAKEDTSIVEPFVFGDVKGREAEKRLRTALHKVSLDEANLPWLLNEIPSLVDSWTQAEEREKDKKK